MLFGLGWFAATYLFVMAKYLPNSMSTCPISPWVLAGRPRKPESPQRYLDDTRGALRRARLRATSITDPAPDRSELQHADSTPRGAHRLIGNTCSPNLQNLRTKDKMDDGAEAMG